MDSRKDVGHFLGNYIIITFVRGVTCRTLMLATTGSLRPNVRQCRVIVSPLQVSSCYTDIKLVGLRLPPGLKVKLLSLEFHLRNHYKTISNIMSFWIHISKRYLLPHSTMYVYLCKRWALLWIILSISFCQFSYPTLIIIRYFLLYSKIIHSTHF